MNSPHQPQQVILNSKFRSPSESINNVSYNLVTPIQSSVGGRISSFSTIYLAKLIQPNQALLNFSVRTDSLEFDYSISLSSLTENYYHTQKDLFEDINNILISLFTENSGQYNIDLLPVLTFDTKTYKSSFTANTTQATSVKIDSNNNNFWFKLGWTNGIYDFAASLKSPSPPSVIPINEMYIQIDGILNESATIKTIYNNNPANDPRIAEIITFNNVSLGDIFVYRGNNIPEYPLHPSNTIGALNIKLLNSIGQPINLDSDYRMVIDFIY